MLVISGFHNYLSTTATLMADAILNLASSCRFQKNPLLKEPLDHAEILLSVALVIDSPDIDACIWSAPESELFQSIALAE
jgi:hypothetical protein